LSVYYIFCTSGNRNEQYTAQLLNGVMISQMHHTTHHNILTAAELSAVRNDHGNHFLECIRQQWRRSNDLAGRSTALAYDLAVRYWLRLAYCFTSVIVWRENKNVTISNHFICFTLTVKQSAALVTCVFRAMTKKGQLFLGKSASGDLAW